MTMMTAVARGLGKATQRLGMVVNTVDATLGDTKPPPGMEARDPFDCLPRLLSGGPPIPVPKTATPGGVGVLEGTQRMLGALDAGAVCHLQILGRQMRAVVPGPESPR